MKKPCWWEGHFWRILHVYNYRSWEIGEECDTSKVTMQCSKCGNIKMEVFFHHGHLDIPVPQNNMPLDIIVE